ncbi:hypothetical protein WA1_36070 [Scytonema hofmannii PCC 7110]|uniref:Uncharacterized protein n=1 Tax=Scytonema hofmannii PCC 7110 TaxID=128403 RepID=A0A139X1R1_9CYAN|nr:hypothetical protein [Scytonema hofmannii]KYC38600.1 hypothetical protein WA1_36070 [Scytonema hofmannii PCC 7110]
MTVTTEKNLITNTTNRTVYQPVIPKNWRLRSGYLSEGNSDFESVHVLIGQFLTDRHSPDPLPDSSLLTENAKFQWGYGKPLDKGD